MTKAAASSSRTVLIRSMACLAVSLLAFGCASTSQRPHESAVVAYSHTDIARIMKLREAGESLADVAKEVGGSRVTVRFAERHELARQREVRRGLRTGAPRATAEPLSVWSSPVLAVGSPR